MQLTDQPTPSSLTCFIIGPIGNRLADIGSPEREIYEQSLRIMAEVIEPACKHHGLEPVRADRLARAGEITEQVFHRLRNDDVVIADLTDANPNVMYELGLRHTRNKLTIQIGEYGRLPFDVNTIRTIQFSSSAMGLINARNELITVLEAGLSGAFDPVTATRIWNNESAAAERAVPLLANSASEAACVVSIPSEGYASTPVISAGSSDDLDASGPIDILAEAEEMQAALPNALEAVNELVIELGALADHSTQEIAQSDAAGRGMRGRLQVILRHAAGLNDIADRLDRNVDEYESILRSVSAGNLVRIDRMEEDAESHEAGYEFGMLIRRLAATTRESLASMAGLVNTMEENAKMARALRDPTRKLTTALDRFAKATGVIDEWDRRLQSLGVPLPAEDWEPELEDESTGVEATAPAATADTLPPSTDTADPATPDGDPSIRS